VSIAAIILAAGASRRLGQPKQLVYSHGETLLARTLRIAHLAVAEPIVVVLGAFAQEIRSFVDLRGAHIVENANWEQGIASSLQAGLNFLEDNESAAAPIRGVLILACDQPRLTPDHLKKLCAAFTNQAASQQNPAIMASAYADVVGIPAIFPRSLFPNLHALTGDQGARSLLRNSHCPLIQLEFSGGELDIDTPEDLKHLS